MGRKSEDFATLDTTTPGKLATIRWQIYELNRVFTPTARGVCVGIPGAGSQCDRHRDEYAAYGFAEKRQFMMDRDKEVHRSQLAWKARTGYGGTVLLGDLEDRMDDIRRAGGQVELVDYDDVSNLEQRHEDFITKAADHGVRAIILVLATRSGNITPYVRRWQERLDIRDELSPKRHLPGRKEYGTPLASIQERAIKAIANRNGYEAVYHFHHKHGPLPSCRYQGRHAMQSCVLWRA